MAERIDGRQFWGGEGAGEAKYEVSHVVGKGSYGVVWWEHFLTVARSALPHAHLNPSARLQRCAEPLYPGESRDQAYRPRPGR